MHRQHKPLVPFQSFEEAWKALPKFIYPDPLYHKRIEDLAFLVQHELDLYNEGEPNEIVGRRDEELLRGSYKARRTHRLVVSNRYRQCRRFLARGGMESEAGRHGESTHG